MASFQAQPVIFNVDYGSWPAGTLAGFPPKKASELCTTVVHGQRGGAPVTVARLASPSEIEAESKKSDKPPEKPPLVSLLITGANVPPYRPGDVAGFPPDVAQELLRNGNARENAPPPESEPKKKKRRASTRTSPVRAVVEEPEIAK